MSNSFRDNNIDLIADYYADQLCSVSEAALKGTAVLVGGLAANGVINGVTGRKRTWTSYLNPLEYFRSAVQFPSTLFAAKSVEEKIGAYFHSQENMEKARPVLKAFFRPIVHAVLSPGINELEAKKLLKLVEPGIWEKLRNNITGSIAKPLNGIRDFVAYPFEFIGAWGEKNIPETNPWKIAEKNAEQYGQKFVDVAGNAIGKAKNYGALPGQLFDVCTNSGIPAYAVAGTAAAGFFLAYLGTRSICNKISMSQSATANAAAAGNVINLYGWPWTSNKKQKKQQP